MDTHTIRKGILWMLASAAFLALGNSIVRTIARELHPFQISFLTNGLVLVIVWPSLATRSKQDGRAERIKLYAITAMIGGVTNLTWFYALAHVPLAEATAITFAAPILVTALAGLVLGEVVSLHRWISVVAGFFGVMIIVRPGFAQIDAGIVTVLISTVGMASTYLLSKRIMRVDTARRAAAMMTAIPVVTGSVPALLVWKGPSLDTMMWVLFMAVAMYCGRLAMLHALKSAPATTVMPFDFARLPFVAAIAFVAYDEKPDLYALAGALIILGATLSIYRQEQGSSRRDVA